MTPSHANEIRVATTPRGSSLRSLAPVFALAVTASACTSDAPAARSAGESAAAEPSSSAAPSAAAAATDPAVRAEPPARTGTAAEAGGEAATPGNVPLTGTGVAPTAAAPGSATDDAAPSARGCWSTNADGSVRLDPEGKVVLFDGTGLNGWRSEAGGPAQWSVLPDQTLQVAPVEPPTDLQTVQSFEDLCLHLEYLTPALPPNVTGQERGNSGIYLESAYELQVLDSVGQPAGIDTCGAIYGISIPLAVACQPQLVWNTYEIEYRTSRWTGDVKSRPAEVVLATLNGIAVQRNVPLPPDSTTAGNPDRPGPQPLLLQDHRNLVKFRNIWATIPTP